MTGCRALLPLAHALAETVDTAYVLSTVTPRPHPRRAFFSVDVPYRRRALSLQSHSSLARVDRAILPEDLSSATDPCP